MHRKFNIADLANDMKIPMYQKDGAPRYVEDIMDDITSPIWAALLEWEQAVKTGKKTGNTVEEIEAYTL